MNKLPVYCDFSYLQNFFSVLSRTTLDPYGDSSRLKDMLDFKDILLSRATLLTDKTDEEIDALCISDELMRILKKKSVSGGSDLIACKDKLDKIKSVGNNDCILHNEPSSLYCLNVDQAIANNIASQYGVICLGRGCFLESSKYRKDPVVLEIGDDFSWWKILSSDIPSQFVVIHDNYLIENVTIDNSLNLKSILRQLVHNSFKGIYNLYILHFIEDQTKLKHKQEIIKEIVHASSLNCKVNIKFIKGRKENLHDRDILTNYLWIHSGHATDIERNRKSTKDTSLHFTDLFNSTDSFLAIQKKVLKKLK
jgi:hypothetical protein